MKWKQAAAVLLAVLVAIAPVQASDTKALTDSLSLGPSATQVFLRLIDGARVVEADSTFTATNHVLHASATVLNATAGDIDLNATAGAINLTATSVVLNATVGGDIDLDADLDFVGPQEISTSSGDLTLSPSGNVVLSSSNLDMGAIGNRIDLDTDNDTSIRASSDDIVSIEILGSDRFNFTASSFGGGAFDNGTGTGIQLQADQNNNGSTPAAGCIRLRDLNGNNRYVWVDATGDLRVGASEPTNSNDTSGTVVGTQN